MKRFWPILFALLAGCAALRALFSEPYPYRVTPGAVKIHGPVARAVGVAFGDFVQVKAAERAEILALDVDAGGLTPEELEKRKPEWECVDSPNFYDAWYHLEEDGGTRYVVEIFPKPEVCYGAGIEIFGGGGFYEIDAKSFGIIKREIGE